MAALYADIAAKQVQARIKQNQLGKTQFEYDSDEDTEGGQSVKHSNWLLYLIIQMVNVH